MFAWLGVQYTAHLYAASIIRAMPETEIPPVIRGDIYLRYLKFPIQNICIFEYFVWGEVKYIATALFYNIQNPVIVYSSDIFGIYPAVDLY